MKGDIMRRQIKSATETKHWQLAINGERERDSLLCGDVLLLELQKIANLHPHGNAISIEYSFPKNKLETQMNVEDFASRLIVHMDYTQ